MLYYEILRLYLRPGLRINKVQHVLKFNQSQWLKSYAKLNTQNKLTNYSQKQSELRQIKNIYKFSAISN